ncbi:Hydrogenase transcriptional regulatory protein hupR1 [Rubripirellula lacrimiformis]|uniref:Hydrogenase transcriptional regulatory protein hupR1 n=1 Tax=Rubripirellula lacrimiformis TaxID=1930273 RepID=A0A517NCZ4_9BACT|nr:response regulator [Rubripirellula lacrimiformis]QDT05010.1 Hydrogenase transcriptional regulatory protein hupR1 [Rubripirellula lacrimiformis]
MNDRILLVDDDYSLLKTLDRNLSFDFDVTICESGAEALELIANSEPFSVAMVDMRMPGMEGIKVIQKAREIAPNTVYLMLTGNQDLTTAMEAVNEGQVFRFLNKPCQMSDIKAAIHAGIKQHDLIISKEELLKKTFAGAISVLVEIIGFVDDPLVNLDDIQKTTETMLTECNVATDWRIALTSHLMVAGIPLLSPEYRAILASAPITSVDHRGAVKEMLRISSQLVRRIPRLEPIADQLDRMATDEIASGRCTASDDKIAQVLLISYYQSLLSRRGEDGGVVRSEIESIFSNVDRRLSDHLRLFAEARPKPTIETIPTTALVAGMIVAEDIRMPNGLLLIAAGRNLSPPMVTRLNNLAGLVTVKVEIPANLVAELVSH